MNRTNVFANAEEIEKMKDAAIEAAHTPVIALSVEGKDFASRAKESVQQMCHRFALMHGLPEIKGYYGCDLQNGEFVSA